MGTPERDEQRDMLQQDGKGRKLVKGVLWFIFEGINEIRRGAGFFFTRVGHVLELQIVWKYEMEY